MPSRAALKKPSWDVEERQQIFSGKRLRGLKSGEKGVDADPDLCFQEQNYSALCMQGDLNEKTTRHYDMYQVQSLRGFVFFLFFFT